MDQDPHTQLALLTAEHGCLQGQLNEANAKIAELSVEISQLKDQNHNLQKDSSKLQVYVDDIVPRLNRKCKEGEEKLEAQRSCAAPQQASEAKLRETETKLREEQAKVQKLYRREQLRATNQVANVQMSSVKHEAVSVIQHSATAAVDPSAQTGPPAANDADAGPRIASPSVSTSNDAQGPLSGAAPSSPNPEAGQSSAVRPDSTQQLANVPANITEVASAAGDSESAENEHLLADASRPHSPVLGPPRGMLEKEREEDEDIKRSEVQEELELNTTQERAVSSTTGAHSPATSKKRGRPQGPSARSTIPRKRKVTEGRSRSSSRVSTRSDAQQAGEHAGGSSPLKPASTKPAVTSIGLTVSPRKTTTIMAQLTHAGRTKKAGARKSPSKEPTMFPSSDLIQFVPAESEEWEDYHWKGRKCPQANCPGPDGARLQWVACDRCEVFYHCICVSGSGKNNAWPKHKSFVCGRCKE